MDDRLVFRPRWDTFIVRVDVPKAVAGSFAGRPTLPPFETLKLSGMLGYS